jgi:hypothetical protein
VRIRGRRTAAGGARVDVLRQSAGRRAVTGPRRVARFRNVKRAVTWRARTARDGFYTVRVRLAGDTRTLVLERRGGRFHARPGAERHAGCGAIRRFTLGRPVFGGATHRSLPVRVRLAPGRRGRIELRRGGRVVRRVSVHGTRTWRLRAGGLRRGAYALRLVSGSARATLHARRL